MSGLEIYEKDDRIRKEKLYLTLRKMSDGHIHLLLVDKSGIWEKTLARLEGGKLVLLSGAKPSDVYDYGDLKFTPEGFLMTALD